MIFRSLRLQGWRNIEAATLNPGPRVTVVFGENGQGKTNLLEAAYVLATFRSFRTVSLQEIIRWGGTAAQLEGELSVAGLQRRLEVRLEGARKTTLLDGKAVRRDASSLRGVAAVLFVPGDLLLPRAAPAERRRFIDRAIFGADRTYSQEASAYERLLKSRNALLRDRAPQEVTLLDSYDEQLARAGARIVLRRRALVSALAPRVTALFAAIHADLGAQIRYRSQPEIEAASAESEIEAALLFGLRSRRILDLRRAVTTLGPHTDDLKMELAGHAAGDHGSQGQLRSLVLALKLAEVAHLEAALGEPPALLLDDVASELDEARREKLFETLAVLPSQTLITVTDPGLLPHFPERQDVRVSGGRPTPIG